MKKYIILIAVMLAGLITTVKADSPNNYTYNAWDNYYYQYGQYFDNFFNKPRVLYHPQDRSAYEATIKLMARYGIPYTNEYTGKYNGVQTPEHIFNTSRTVEEYRYRMEIWKRFGNVVY